MSLWRWNWIKQAYLLEDLWHQVQRKLIHRNVLYRRRQWHVYHVLNTTNKPPDWKKHDTHKLSHFCTKIVFVFLYRKRDITARQRPNQCTTAWSKATEASSHINKSVFSLLHRLSTWRYLHLLLSIDGTDIQTDGRTDAQPLCRPCSAFLAGASMTFSHDCRNSSDYAKLLNRFKF